MKFNGLGIHVKVNNISASRAFYEDLVGLVPVFGYGDEEFRATLPGGIPSVTGDGLPGAPERYRGVTYELTPDSPLEIADGHIAVEDPSVFSERVPGPKVSAMVRVDSIADLLRRGLSPTFPVRRYYWGTIELVIRDPDGFVLVFIAPYSESEMAAVTEFTAVAEVLS